MEENHLGWKLVKGVRQDVVNLFKLFASTNSVRYEEFCKVWKQINFSLIFSNRTMVIEAIEFTEELFQIVKEYLLSVYEFQTRVAALYTLYGLYFKQPLRDAAKIRLTKSEWEEVNNLILNCKAEKHYDVAFIHLKLYLSGAYSFTANIRTVGLERGFKKYSDKKCNTLPLIQNTDLLYRPLISQTLVKSLVQLESLYCKKKAEMLGKKNIVFVDGKFATSLQEELTNYACGGQKLVAQPIEVTVEDETEEIGAVRASIKNRSYASNKNQEIPEEFHKEEVEEFKNRKRKGNKLLEIVAKKKAEFYIKQLQDKCNQQEEDQGMAPTKFELPELDFLSK